MVWFSSLLDFVLFSRAGALKIDSVCRLDQHRLARVENPRSMQRPYGMTVRYSPKPGTPHVDGPPEQQRQHDLWLPAEQVES
jgi:hypothetical protein